MYDRLHGSGHVNIFAFLSRVHFGLSNVKLGTLSMKIHQYRTVDRRQSTHMYRVFFVCVCTGDYCAVFRVVLLLTAARHSSE